MYIEIKLGLTPAADIYDVSFVLSTNIVTFISKRKLIDGREIKVVKRVSEEFISDPEVFKRLKLKAIEILITNPPDTSWLKCPFCGLVPPAILELIKMNRLKEFTGKGSIQCSYCNRFFRLPKPPRNFPFYLEI